MVRNDCVSCKKTVRARQEAVLCDECNRWQHRTCHTGISREQYRRMVKEITNVPFMCQQCQRPEAESTRTSFTYATEPSSNNNTDEPVEVWNTESTSMTSIDVIPPPGQESSSLEDTTSRSGPVFEASDSSFDVTDRLPIPVPPQITEESIEEEAPCSTDDIEAEVTFTVVDSGSQRGKRKLVSSDGYTYVLKRQQKTTTEWRCSVRNKNTSCSVTVRQSGDAFIRNERTHNHPSKPGILTAVQMQTKLKSIAGKDMFEPGPSIVDRVLEEQADSREPPSSRPAYNNMVRTTNRVRQNKRPHDPPADLRDFNLNEEYLSHTIPETFYRGEVLVGDKRHFVFATELQLEALSRTKTWYMDGTFKVVKSPFYQLLSIHAFLKSGEDIKQFPLCFAVMSGKKSKDYKKVIQFIVGLLPTTSVEIFVADFEAGLWKALRKVFVEPVIQGCAFHYGQALWRRVQEYSLQAAYNQHDSVYKYLRKFFALPFLPADDIPQAFTKLRDLSTEQTQSFVDYVERTWISSSIWTVSSWSVYGRSVRTNNDVEGYHNRLNRRAKKGNLPFYLLLTLLYQEASLLPTQKKMLSEGKLRRQQRKDARRTQGKIFDLWDRYSRKEISVNHLLKQCAHIYGPVE